METFGQPTATMQPAMQIVAMLRGDNYVIELAVYYRSNAIADEANAASRQEALNDL